MLKSSRPFKNASSSSTAVRCSDSLRKFKKWAKNSESPLTIKSSWEATRALLTYMASSERIQRLSKRVIWSQTPSQIRPHPSCNGRARFETLARVLDSKKEIRLSRSNSSTSYKLANHPKVIDWMSSQAWMRTKSKKSLKLRFPNACEEASPRKQTTARIKPS